MLGRLNSPGNVNLRNLTPSTLVQPNHAQNLSNSINSLGRMHLVHPTSTQSPSLFHGIQSSLELNQLQQNKGTANFNSINNSRIIRTDNLLNSSTSNPLMLHGNAQPHCMASFTSESFNSRFSGSCTWLDPGKCNESWHNSVESSRMHSNPLLSAEPFPSQLLLNGLRENSSYVQNSPTDLSSSMACENTSKKKQKTSNNSG